MRLPIAAAPLLPLLLLLPAACGTAAPPRPVAQPPGLTAAVAGAEGGGPAASGPGEGAGSMSAAYPYPDRTGGSDGTGEAGGPSGRDGSAGGLGSEAYPDAAGLGRPVAPSPFYFPHVAVAPAVGEGEGRGSAGSGTGTGIVNPAGGRDPAAAATPAGALPDLAPPPADGPLSPEQRRAFLAQAIGFAAGVTGGLAGPEVWVTQLGDRGEGSLRAALEAPGPAWVRLGVDGVIRLKRPILVKSDKTLDGRGRRVELIGRGLVLDRVSNVVLSHLVVHDGADDAVSLTGSRMVWLDHLSLARFDDGLIDITNQSGEVTVSWCRLEDHDKGMLVGSKDWQVEDVSLRVTVHHSAFLGVRYRHPKLRYGYMHLFNLLIEGWTEAAIDVSHGGRLLLEESLLLPGDRKPGPVFGLPVDLRDPPGFARARGVDAGVLALPADPRVEDPPYAYRAEPLSPELVRRLREETGWRP